MGPTDDWARDEIDCDLPWFDFGCPVELCDGYRLLLLNDLFESFSLAPGEPPLPKKVNFKK